MSDTSSNLSLRIAGRRTRKVIGQIEAAVTTSSRTRDEITAMLETAGNAPFHYPCDRIHLEHFSSPVPWRAYVLDTSAKSDLMTFLLENGDTTKVPNMIAAAEYLIQVTWLPDEGTLNAWGEEEIKFSGTLRNMEHIAAASAFVQSLILIAEEQGFQTYWSSGGPLRGPDIFKKLGIPDFEQLLGSIFLYPQNVGDAEVKSGKLAESRGNVDTWSKWIT